MKRIGLVSSESEFSAGLRRFLDLHQLSITNEAIQRCAEHWTVLCRWNRVMNLVGDLNLDSALGRHYGECIFLASQLSSKVQSVFDFGSGAGFPGVVVAACCPQLQVHLVESREKRAAFLSEATRHWPNCRVHCSVAERVRVSADTIVSRAVAWESVAGLAEGLGADLLMLVGSNDAKLISDSLERRGFVGSSLPVPWRLESSVLSFSRNR